jgi:hypothetical protein
MSHGRVSAVAADQPIRDNGLFLACGILQSSLDAICERGHFGEFNLTLDLDAEFFEARL